MAEDIIIGFGDKFEYKGKNYFYIDEIKVKLRIGKESKWVTCILYNNKEGKFAREKSEFLKRFTKCQR
jgi:hypothetical protein